MPLRLELTGVKLAAVAESRARFAGPAGVRNGSDELSRVSQYAVRVKKALNSRWVERPKARVHKWSRQDRPLTTAIGPSIFESLCLRGDVGRERIV